jgi:hypothetical protein
MTRSEAWLRGILPDLHPVIGHLIRAGRQIREDLEDALAPLEPNEVWGRPHGMTPAGFHAKHLAGSTQRLCAYLEGRALCAEELAAIDAESAGDQNAAQLIQLIETAFDFYESRVRELKPEDFGTVRYVGRSRLPVTAVGLAIHIAEHGQRHVGQAISAAKLAMALRHA